MAAAALVGSLLVAPSGAQAAPFDVGNRVWRDTNLNGVQDDGELGVAGVTVQLLTADRKQLLDETTTDASGSYTLVGDSPGAFRIRVLPPDGCCGTRGRPSGSRPRRRARSASTPSRRRTTRWCGSACFLRRGWS